MTNSASAPAAAAARENRQIIARNSIVGGVERALTILVSMIGSVAVARCLGPAKLGPYNYILWVATITGQFASFGVPSAARKYVAEYLGREEISLARKIVGATMRFQFYSALVVVGAGLVIVQIFSSADRRVYTSVAVVSLLPYMLMSVLGAIHSAVEDFTANAWASVLSSVFGLVAMAVVLIMGWDLVGLACVLLLTRICDYGIRHWLYIRRFPKEESEAQPIDVELRRRIIRFCLQSSALLLINMVVWDRSELFFLNIFSDPRELAFYSLGFGLSQQLMWIPLIFVGPIGATMLVQFGKSPSALKGMAETSIKYLALIIMPLTLGMAALSAPAIRVIYGEKYLPAIPLMALAAVFNLSRVLMLAVQQLIVASDEQQFLVKWGVISGIVNLGLDLLLIPHGAALGAVWANGIAQTVAAVGIWEFARRRFSIHLPGNAVSRIFASSLGMGVISWLVAVKLPPLAGLLAGMLAGCVTLLILLRFTRSMDVEDRERLLSVQRQLPAFLRSQYRAAICFVAP